MAGKKTWADCMDIDSHDIIGWYGLPTQFDPTGGRSYGADAVRFLPVVHLPLGPFPETKAVLRCFSRAALGVFLRKLGHGAVEGLSLAATGDRPIAAVQRQL